MKIPSRSIEVKDYKLPVLVLFCKSDDSTVHIWYSMINKYYEDSMAWSININHIQPREERREKQHF